MGIHLGFYVTTIILTRSIKKSEINVLIRVTDETGVSSILKYCARMIHSQIWWEQRLSTFDLGYVCANKRVSQDWCELSLWLQRLTHEAWQLDWDNYREQDRER